MNSNDTVIVIGGSSGMGLAVARRCLNAGASVVIAGRSPERLRAALAELACPDRVRTVTADVAHRPAAGLGLERSERSSGRAPPGPGR